MYFFKFLNSHNHNILLRLKGSQQTPAFSELCTRHPALFPLKTEQLPYLTIFTAPKPFTDPHIRTIQRNAIRSWTELDDVEVFLVGDEPGIAETAAEFGLSHFPEVRCNDWGTPLVNSIFDLARQNSTSLLLCYVNADILLMPDLVESARRVQTQSERFLIIGRRWDLDVTQPLEFPQDWVAQLRKRTFSEGSLHHPAGSDYFVFPRELFDDMPGFAIGRAGWDNWAIYHAVKQGWDTIDATHDVMIVHQNHDYRHLPGGKPHYDQEESLVNIRLARGPENNYTGYMLIDTNRELRDGRIVHPRFSLLRLVRRLEVFIIPPGESGFRWWITRRLRRLRKRLV